MRQLVGDLLPAAVAVATSPLPVIAVFLMLFPPQARSASVAFLAGRAVGLTLLSAGVGMVVVDLVGPVQRRGPLEELRGWLTAHNAAVMTVRCSPSSASRSSTRAWRESRSR